MGRRKEKNYMIRSEKRPNYRSPSPVRPPKKPKSPVGYTVLTMILLVLAYPVGLILLWLKKIRWNWIVKLLTTLVTGFAFFLLMSYLLTVPVQNEAVARIQQAGKARVDQIYDAGAELAEQGRDALNTSIDWVGQRLGEAGNFIGDQAEQLLHKISGSPTTEPTQTPTITEAPKASATPNATEAPKATATPGVTLAPIPSPTAQVMVWVAGDNSYYHASYDCEGLSGAHQISLSDAVAKGYIACNRCNPPELSMEEMLSLLPEDQANALRATLQTASPVPTEAPRQPSFLDRLFGNEPTAAPTPVPTAEPTLAPTAEPTAVPTPEPTAAPTLPPAPEVTPKPAGEILVWHSLPGKGSYYHLDENCSGMYGAKQYTLQSSVEQGFKRCNKCGAPDLEALKDQTVVWVSKDGVMHITDECKAGQGAQFMSLEEALKQGTELKSCEECGARAYLDYAKAYGQEANAPDAADLDSEEVAGKPTGTPAVQDMASAAPDAASAPTPQPVPSPTFRVS